MSKNAGILAILPDCLPHVLCAWYNLTMKAYDFDRTIIKSNSLLQFNLFCYIRLPYLLLYTPVQFVFWLLYVCRIINKNAFLHGLAYFVHFIPKKEWFVRHFWDKNMWRFKDWYLKQRQDDDLIISASPRFLVEEACHRLGLTVIATELDLYSGKLTGAHCYGYKKVECYKAQFGDTPLEAFYSDSYSDIPMFKLAKLGYLVKGDKITLCYKDGQCLVDIDEQRHLKKAQRATKE